MTFSSSNTEMHATPDRESTREREAGRDLAEALNWLLPIHFFYEKSGLPLPDFLFMPG